MKLKNKILKKKKRKIIKNNHPNHRLVNKKLIKTCQIKKNKKINPWTVKEKAKTRVDIKI